MSTPTNTLPVEVLDIVRIASAKAGKQIGSGCVNRGADIPNERQTEAIDAAFGNALITVLALGIRRDFSPETIAWAESQFQKPGQS